MFRAYIPSNAVSWFSELITDREEIDVWLSIRRNRNKQNELFKNYKYFCEFGFKYNTEEMLGEFLNDLQANNIKFEIIIEDLHIYLNETLSRQKRLTTERNSYRNNTMRYQSFYTVSFILFK